MIKTNKLENLPIQIFADLAEPQSINFWLQQAFIKGLTTNPSLMSTAKITNYTDFARKIIEQFPNLPISFEIIADDFASMLTQARIISRWGNAVYVKLPVVNSQGQSTLPILQILIAEEIPVNITAIMTEQQVINLLPALNKTAKLIFSVFCGRIADTGSDPSPLILQLATYLSSFPQVQLLWASTREVLNIFQAAAAGADIITVPESILSKLSLLDKDLTEYSKETVQQFYRDSQTLCL